MKSIKPGRGPSGMSFIGSVFAVVFGVLFVILGFVQAAYHLKNATGKDRFSTFVPITAIQSMAIMHIARNAARV